MATAIAIIPPIIPRIVPSEEHPESHLIVPAGTNDRDSALISKGADQGRELARRSADIKREALSARGESNMSERRLSWSPTSVKLNEEERSKC
jgi:hypothetical protein